MKPLRLRLCCVFSLLVTAAASQATVFNIANGDVTALRNAIISANGNGQDDTIELFPGGLYNVVDRAASSGLNGFPLIGADGGHQLIIHGNGATIQRAGGAPTFRFFTTNSGANVTLSGLILTNGSPGAFHGGAVYNNFDETGNTTLTIMNCTISSCSGDNGGAIFNDGYQDPASPAHTSTLTVLNCTISGNTGTQYGGGIWNESGGIVMNVSNSTFSGNSANARSAGAIQFDGSAGTATGSIVNCTFTHNSAATEGGAVNVDGAGGSNANGDPTNGSAILNITNCTFDQNTADLGGGLAMDGSNDTLNGATGTAVVRVTSCSFSGNFSTSLGDAIYLSETNSGTTVLHVGNSILASSDPDFNISTDNMSGGTVTVFSDGYNLSDDAACGVSPCNNSGTGPGGLLDQTGDKRNTAPGFDPAGLKNNGGPTQTIALLSNSPAIDQGKATTSGTTNNDQRGEPRPFNDPFVAPPAGGDSSDIGAYEADVRVISEVRNLNDLIMTFTTVLGRSYELQSRPNLLPATPWTTVGSSIPAPPVAGTGGVVQITAPNAIGTGPGFYRVHQL